MANEYLTPQQAQYLYQKLLGELATLSNTVTAMQNDPVDVTGSESAASASDTTICSTAQYGAGVYLVSAYASFPASSSGRRHIHLATTNTGSALDNWSQLTFAPSNAQPTVMNMTGIYKRTSTGRWYLRCYQNSGSTQTVSGGIRVLKLH